MLRFVEWYRVGFVGALFFAVAGGWAIGEIVSLVSRTSDGKPLSAPVTSVAISRDGSVLAFGSKASNLAAEGLSTTGVYVYTRRDGRVVALPIASATGRDRGIRGLTLSPEGRFVAFVSESGEVFLHDRTAKDTTALVRNEPGPMGPCSGEIRVSAEADIIALTAPAPSFDDKKMQVWVMERGSGSVSAVSKSESGNPGAGSSVVAGVTPDGRYILFLSDAKDLLGAPSNGFRQVFRYDRETGRIEIVSLGTDGKPAKSNSTAAAISDDGSLVAFVSADDALTSGDSNKAADVFVRDLRLKATERCTTGPMGVDPASVAISGDGRRVFFLSSSPTLPGTGGANLPNVFCYSRTDKSTRCVSLTASGARADGKCASPVTDASGGVCAFLSSARNLGATGGVASLFVTDLSAAVGVGQPEGGDKAMRQRLDLNGDGKLDQLDVDALVKQIGKGDLRYDLNGDGEVDLRDLNLLLQHMDLEV